LSFDDPKAAQPPSALSNGNNIDPTISKFIGTVGSEDSTISSFLTQAAQNNSGMISNDDTLSAFFKGSSSTVNTV
jgi:hypothetical protein